MNEQKTILVVDDDKAINQLLVNSLSFKYQADAVESGAAAIEYCKTKKPHAILLDLNLGDYDGREVCQVLKREFGDKTPPIVFISGDQDEQNIISCFDNGADDFIAKPFTNEDVLQAVEKANWRHYGGPAISRYGAASIVWRQHHISLLQVLA